MKQYPFYSSRTYPLSDRTYPGIGGGSIPADPNALYGYVPAIANFFGNVVSESNLWSPYSLGTQLVAWYNPSSISGNSGDQIETWSDISGNANHGTQTTSVNRAVLITSYFAGRKFFNFSAFSHQMYNLPGNLLGASSEAAMYTILAVKSDPPAATGETGLYRIQNNGNDNHFPYVDGNVYDGFFSTSRKSTGNPSQDLRSLHLINMISKSGFYSLSIDAASHYQTTTNVIGVVSGEYKYGQSDNGIAAYLNGYQSDLIFVSGALSSSDNSKMEGFLAHTNSIASFLPGGHPYVNSPPT